MKKPILVSLILLNLPWKASMLETPTACWSGDSRWLLVTEDSPLPGETEGVCGHVTRRGSCPAHHIVALVALGIFSLRTTHQHYFLSRWLWRRGKCDVICWRYFQGRDASGLDLTKRGRGLSQVGESGRRPWLDVGCVDLVEVIFFGVSGDVELAKADVTAGTCWLTGRWWSAIDTDDPGS